MDEFGLGDYDDEDDEDYEYFGGENALYESRIDEYDELKILRDTLTEVNSVSPDNYNRMIAGVPADQKAKFDEIMQGIDTLLEQEKKVREQVEEIEKKKKEKGN